MMNPQAPQTGNVVLSFFGKAFGLVVAMLATMPAYHASYDYLWAYNLGYSNTAYHELIEWCWIACLFLLIFTATWFAVTLIVSLLGKLMIYLAIKLNVRGHHGNF